MRKFCWWVFGVAPTFVLFAGVLAVVVSQGAEIFIADALGINHNAMARFANGYVHEEIDLFGRVTKVSSQPAIMSLFLIGFLGIVVVGLFWGLYIYVFIDPPKKKRKLSRKELAAEIQELKGRAQTMHLSMVRREGDVSELRRQLMKASGLWDTTTSVPVQPKPRILVLEAPLVKAAREGKISEQTLNDMYDAVEAGNVVNLDDALRGGAHRKHPGRERVISGGGRGSLSALKDWVTEESTAQQLKKLKKLWDEYNLVIPYKGKAMGLAVKSPEPKGMDFIDLSEFRVESIERNNDAYGTEYIVRYTKTDPEALKRANQTTEPHLYSGILSRAHSVGGKGIHGTST